MSSHPKTVLTPEQYLEIERKGASMPGLACMCAITSILDMYAPV